MREHGLTFRKFHIEKRGGIDKEQADLFLETLSAAIIKYGPNKVLNMDKTMIRLDNSENYTITHKGATSVFVQRNYNDEKTGTTYLATISYNPQNRYPLVLVAKGKTPRCEEKYGEFPNVIKMHSESGWCNDDIMEAYLDLLVTWCEPPFALVLDIYSSHRKEEVKAHAAKLGIQLIFVPACGTGVYQPLDIKVFGVLKKRLTEKDRQGQIKVSSHIQTYQIVNERVSDIWKKISDKIIQSAWKIPGLDIPVQEQ